MRVVIDTNVIVSGLLSPHGPPGEIVRMVASGSLEVCYDARILSEYAGVLPRPKFRLDRVEAQHLLEKVERHGWVVSATPLAKRLPDRNDEKFLEVALAGGAEYLVTGNLKHYPPAKRQSVRVVSPAEFLALYRERQ